MKYSSASCQGNSFPWIQHKWNYVPLDMLNYCSTPDIVKSINCLDGTVLAGTAQLTLSYYYDYLIQHVWNYVPVEMLWPADNIFALDVTRVKIFPIGCATVKGHCGGFCPDILTSGYRIGFHLDILEDFIWYLTGFHVDVLETFIWILHRLPPGHSGGFRVDIA